MSEKTNIAWCDSTINFWIGCTKVLDENGKLTDSGCKECYADEMDKNRISRTLGGGTKENPIRHWGKGAPRYKVGGAVKDALALNRKPWICDGCGDDFTNDISPTDFSCSCGCKTVHRRRIFSLSLGDWLDEEVPIEWLAEMLDTIRQCDQVTWILCSKRWENFQPLLQTLWRKLAFSNNPLSCWIASWALGHIIPQNIIGLCSVENQPAADKRIPQFLTVPLACRGLSMEPLLGPVEITKHLPCYKEEGRCKHARIKWLIIGGESGPSARQCNVEWIHFIVEQGEAAGVATFVKQLGAFPVQQKGVIRLNKLWPAKTHFVFNEACSPGLTLADLSDKKGGDMDEWPMNLRLQQWPKGF